MWCKSILLNDSHFFCRFFTSLHFYSNFMHTYYKLSVQIVALWHRKSVARTKRRFLHFVQPWIAVRFPVGKLLSRKDLNASPAGIVRRKKRPFSVLLSKNQNPTVTHQIAHLKHSGK